MTNENQPDERGSAIKTIEEHAEDMGVKPWEFAAAKAREGWAEGQEVKAKVFGAAISQARKERVG